VGNYEEAHAAVDRGDHLEALKLWRALADEEPTAFWPRYWSANCLVFTGNRKQGRAELEILIDHDLVEWQLPIRLAELALEDCDPDKASIWFRRATQFPDIEPLQRTRIASLIIRLQHGGRDFSPTVFDIDPDLAAEMAV